METKFVHLPVNDLSSHPFTPSLVDDGDYEQLAYRLRLDDYLEPLLVIRDTTDNCRIVDGHLRLRAAIEAGFETVPVLEVTANEHETDEDLEIVALTQMLNETTRPLSRNRKAEGIRRLCELERVGDNDRSQRSVASRLGMSEASLRNWLNRAHLLAEADNGRTNHTRDEIENLSQQDVRAAVAALKGDADTDQETDRRDTDGEPSEKRGHAGLERTFRVVAKENPERVVEALRNALDALHDDGIDLTAEFRFAADEQTAEGSDSVAYIDMANFNRLIGHYYGHLGGVGEIDQELAKQISEASGESLSANTLKKIRTGTIRQPSAKKLQAFADHLGYDTLTKSGRKALPQQRDA